MLPLDKDEQIIKTHNGSGINFNPEITLGSILQVLVIICSVGFAIITYANKVDNNQNDMRALRADITTQMNTIQTNVNDSFLGIRRDIANLPDLRAELAQIEKRLDQEDNRDAAQSSRLEQIQQMSIQNSSDIAGMIRASAAKVGRNVP